MWEEVSPHSRLPPNLSGENSESQAILLLSLKESPKNLVLLRKGETVMRKSLWVLSLAIIVLVFSILILTSFASTDSDTDPPHLADFDFEPKVINTSELDQDITFTAHITDDISGIRPYANGTSWFNGIQFKSASGEQSIQVDLTWSRGSGTPLDGIYVAKETLPQYSETGVWKLSWVTLADRLGNHRNLSQDDVTGLGIPTEFLMYPDFIDPPVDIREIQAIVINLGKDRSDANWDAIQQFDLDKDGDLDILDVTYLVKAWRQ